MYIYAQILINIKYFLFKNVVVENWQKIVNFYALNICQKFLKMV